MYHNINFTDIVVTLDPGPIPIMGQTDVRASKGKGPGID